MGYARGGGFPSYLDLEGYKELYPVYPYCLSIHSQSDVLSHLPSRLIVYFINMRYSVQNLYNIIIYAIILRNGVRA